MSAQPLLIATIQDTLLRGEETTVLLRALWWPQDHINSAAALIGGSAAYLLASHIPSRLTTRPVARAQI